MRFRKSRKLPATAARLTPLRIVNAADLLGISPRTLAAKMKEHGLE